ncbi:MAG: thioesterase family protein [Rhodospirillaceae bacterium]
MARIKIDLPEFFAFTTEVAVYIGHINYGHHLDNAALLSLVSEARVRFFQSMGYTELNVEGAGIIIADAAVQYRSEVRHGEVLVFQISVMDFNKYGCDIVWKATEKVEGREVARGKTGIIFFDYKESKKVSVPLRFKELSA